MFSVEFLSNRFTDTSYEMNKLILLLFQNWQLMNKLIYAKEGAKECTSSTKE